jgi:hypothetical protein
MYRIGCYSYTKQIDFITQNRSFELQIEFQLAECGGECVFPQTHYIIF